NGNHWLTVRTLGTTSNRDGIGARVRVFSQGVSQLKEVRAGSSFASMDSPWLTFGLGARDRVDRVEVDWPSGAVDAAENVGADQFVVFREGEGIIPFPDCNGNHVSDW